MRTRRSTFFLATLLITSSNLAARAAENHTFGSHPMSYAAGSIRPNHLSQAALDQAVRDFYDQWKERFLRQDCGAGRYVVVTHTQPGNLTVSEGHGYGMILAALMAGHEPDAQTIFDGMYAYFLEHPTEFHDHLMAYYQNNSCTSPSYGLDSASDGDLDIAFALLLADKQWGSCGAIDYLAEAAEVIADVKDGDLDAGADYVLLGDWVVPSGNATYYDSTRSSDFMPDHYRSFEAATGDTDFSGLLDQTYAIVDDLQTTHSPTTGLLPDFVTSPLASPLPAPPGFLEGPNDGAYSYNACRDPWRLATDYVVSGEARAKTAVETINDWIQSETGGDPANIASGYRLDGSIIPGSEYLSMAFIAPLGVGAMVDASNQTWLNTLWDFIDATPADTDGYYENTLKLLSMIVMSGNWWAPETVTGGCTPGGTALCTSGGSLSNAAVKIGRATGASGEQTLRLTGNVFFPLGAPSAAALVDGAQLLLEDLGAGSAALFELTEATAAVPPSSQSGCDPRDGWTSTSSKVRYRNVSTAVDPPACTPGSARGLTQLQYRSRSALDLDFSAKAKRASIAAPVGPVRATIVFGSTSAAGAAGKCGVSASLACTTQGANARCE